MTTVFPMSLLWLCNFKRIYKNIIIGIIDEFDEFMFVPSKWSNVVVANTLHKIKYKSLIENCICNLTVPFSEALVLKNKMHFFTVQLLLIAKKKITKNFLFLWKTQVHLLIKIFCKTNTAFYKCNQVSVGKTRTFKKTFFPFQEIYIPI
jgi:hypothetical protein